MRKRINVLVFLVCILSNFCVLDAKDPWPVLKGPYLGMEPPGDVPKLFAPGVVSSIFWEHSGAVFSPDGNELFWSLAVNEGRDPRIIVIVHMKQVNGIWGPPELAPFNIANYNHINSISPDGKRLYFFSGHMGCHVVNKTETGWGKPELLSINQSDKPGRHINEVHETKRGNLYLYGPHQSIPGGRGIICSKRIDGKYQPYQSLGTIVNLPFDKPFPNHSPTVDPDERFVVFVSKRAGGYSEDQDLYISYRQSDGSWSEAVNLGPKINGIGIGNSWPQLSPDGKYLFFYCRERVFNKDDIKTKQYSYSQLVDIQKGIKNGWGNIYWVSTSFVEKLRPDTLR